MNSYSRTHLNDGDLLRQLDTRMARDWTNTAELLADLGEVDARRLYLPAAYPSMYGYCTEKLHFSEDAAAKRIQAARTARRFPAIFTVLAEGRLHLSAVVLLAPHLTPENAGELIAAATHKSKTAILQLLAARFPRPALLTQVCAGAPEASSSETLAPGTDRAASHAPGHVVIGTCVQAPGCRYMPRGMSSRGSHGRA